MKKPNLAILGATGAVGAEFITLIEERNFPYENLKLLASARSAGTELTVNGKTYVVEEAKPESFDGIDIALFAGGSISKTLAPELLNAVLLLLITPVHSVWIQKYHSLCLKLTLKIF